MADAPTQLLTSVLRDVSRSFYLTLRVLPSSIRSQISLAYLLARTADSIADTGLVPVGHRLRALEALRDRIRGSSRQPVEFGELASHQGAPAEGRLLEECETSLACLHRLAPADLERVRKVLTTIISGQELDLRRFASASRERLVALGTAADLEDYAYRVAGCVGEFWTLMCRAHVFAKDPLDDSSLVAQGVRFGNGLQLVNILRDLPVDLRQGRCYLPGEELTAAGLKPEDLLRPEIEPRMRPVYDAWLDRAETHLHVGWVYTNTLPRRCFRVRLACAWPLLIGRETLVLLRQGNVLNPQRRLKASRRQVRQILWRSVLCYPWPAAWRSLFPPAASNANPAGRDVRPWEA
jgi:farnesyl-diphosphate farnesyltransferase